MEVKWFAGTYAIRKKDSDDFIRTSLDTDLDYVDNIELQEDKLIINYNSRSIRQEEYVQVYNLSNFLNYTYALVNK